MTAENNDGKDALIKELADGLAEAEKEIRGLMGKLAEVLTANEAATGGGGGGGAAA